MSAFAQFSTYNATTDSFIIPAIHVPLLKSSYALTLYYGTLEGASLMIFIAFLLLSTKQQRQRKTFGLLVASFIMLLFTTHLVLQHTRYIRRAYFSKDHTYGHKLNAFRPSAVMDKMTCFVASLTLIFKVKSCYPAPTYSTRQQHVVIFPLVGLAVIRLPTIVLFGVAAGREKHSLCLKSDLADFALQIAFSLYSSAVLLCKASAVYTSAAQYHQAQLKRRARFLIESILFTLLVPLIFQIGCSVALIKMLLSHKDVHILRDFNCFNLFSTVLFALFSTTWSVIRNGSSNEASSDSQRGKLCSAPFVTSFFAVSNEQDEKKVSPIVEPSEGASDDAGNASSTGEAMNEIPLHFNVESAVMAGELQLVH